MRDPDDRFANLNQADQRRYMAQAIGCDPDARSGPSVEAKGESAMSAERMASGESYFISGPGDPAELRPLSGDVIFPREWTGEMAAAWRRDNLIPGTEWSRDPGQ